MQILLQNGCTALHRAVQFGNIEVVKRLLHAGCQQLRDKKGITPLYIAHNRNHTEIAKLLKPLNNQKK